MGDRQPAKIGVSGPGWTWVRIPPPPLPFIGRLVDRRSRRPMEEPLVKRGCGHGGRDTYHCGPIVF